MLDTIRESARQITPPIIWKAARYALRIAKYLLGQKVPEAYRDISYQSVTTGHNAKPLHEGRFARLYEQYQPLDPFVPVNKTRLRIYNACLFARICAKVEGDFVAAGISYGVASRVIYDFIEFGKLGKTYYFIDPFTAIENAAGAKKMQEYNNSLEYVRSQYPQNALIQFHQRTIPDCLPIEGVKSLSFVHLNTADYDSEAKSLPYFYGALSAGGVIIIDAYAHGGGHFEIYDPVLKQLGIEPYWMATGQCAIVKT